MTISLLTALVTLETFIILLGVIAFLARRHSKLKKAFDQLLASMSESIFPKLVAKEIDHTIERINDTIPAETDELDLAADEDSAIDEDDEDARVKKILTFRSAYLHAEINAYDDSVGDKDMFWHYLAENIAELMPQAQTENTEENQTGTNEFLDEIMQELQTKLDKSVESNLSLQALLDSLMNEGQLSPDQISKIKNSQADFHDLNQHLSDLDNKIQNSLNIEITTQVSRNNTSPTEKTLIIEKSSNKVNTEVNKLKDIIYDQGNKINNLLKNLKSNVLDSGLSTELQEQLKELERSQQETSMCMEILEMENHRLIEELENIHNDSSNDEPEMQLKIKELEQIIAEKDFELEALKEEFNSVQNEYIAAYEKGRDKQK